MESKQEILAKFRPKAVLKALTPQARRAVPSGMLVDDLLPLLRLPFRIGRESRVQKIEGLWHRVERPRNFDGPQHEPTNEVYLLDGGELLQISREHLQIEEVAGGGWRVVDRGSACGSVVGGKVIGGEDAGGAGPLADGDTIVLGVEGVSPYRYQFITLG